MKTEIVKVNGISIECPYENEQHWVAVRSICQALGIDHKSQFLRIENDEILKDVYSDSLYASDTKGRQVQMFCLPLEFVFGWLFSIDDSKVSAKAKPTFISFKRECYKGLYNHFFGKTYERLKMFATQIETQEQIAKVEEELAETPKGLELKTLTAKLKETKKDILRFDKEAITGQLTMFNDKKE